MTLKVKFQDFQQIPRRRSFSAPVESRAELANGTVDLLAPLFPTRKGVRLLGVSQQRRPWRAGTAISFAAVLTM